MSESTAADSQDPSRAQPPWTNPNLHPDQFLNERQGPWPQPAPTYPMARPQEVVNIPAQEYDAWWAIIDARLGATFESVEHIAPAEALFDLTRPLPTDADVVAENIERVMPILRIGELALKGFSEPFACFEITQLLPSKYVKPVLTNPVISQLQTH